MMENSDIDDDFTLDGNALHRNKKEKDLRKKEDLLAVLVIMVRVAMRLDDDDDDVVVVLVAIVLAPANIIRVCLARLLSGRSDVCKVSIISPNNTRTQRRNRRHTNTKMLFSLPSFMNRKPFRRFLILFLVFVLIPFSGRMFYMQKLDFLRHRQQRNVSLVLHHLNKSSSSNNATTNHHHPQVEQEQHHQKHEEEEKRLLEGNPLADG
jgi:hypothetical protein